MADRNVLRRQPPRANHVKPRALRIVALQYIEELFLYQCQASGVIKPHPRFSTTGKAFTVARHNDKTVGACRARQDRGTAARKRHGKTLLDPHAAIVKPPEY